MGYGPRSHAPTGARPPPAAPPGPVHLEPLDVRVPGPAPGARQVLLLLAALALLLGLASPAAAGGLTTPPPPETPAPTGAPQDAPSPADASPEDASPEASPGDGDTDGADDETSSIFTVLRLEGEPVVGGEITVVDASGRTIGTGTSDDRGRAEVEVPGEGSYTVTVDPDTLPEEADVQGGVERTVAITQNLRPKPVIYRLAESAAAESRLDRLPQLVAEGLYTGLLIALAAVGLSLIFGTTGLTNFAHGELVTFGGLAAWYMNDAGVPIVLALALSLVAGGAFGVVNDRGLWRPLRRRGTGLIAMLVVSIGLSLLLRNLYQLVYGGGTRVYGDFIGQRAVQIGPVGLAPKDLISMAVCTVVIVAVGLVLVRTRIGTATRAVADNKDLAASSGIDVQRVILFVWVVGAALAALAGALIGLRIGVNFQFGFQQLLLIFAGVTLGGLGTAFGAFVGSLVIGVAIETSTLFVPPEFKTVVALAVLIGVLLVRPQGIFGSRERIG